MKFTSRKIQIRSNFHKKHGFCTGAALLACSPLEIVAGWHLPPSPPPDLLGCWQDDLLHHRLCAPPLHLRHCWHLWPPHRLGTPGLHLSCLWPQQLLRHQPVRRQNQKQAAMVISLVPLPTSCCFSKSDGDPVHMVMDLVNI